MSESAKASDIAVRLCRIANDGNDQRALLIEAVAEIENLLYRVAEYEREEAEYDRPPDALVAHLRAKVARLEAESRTPAFSDDADLCECHHWYRLHTSSGCTLCSCTLPETK